MQNRTRRALLAALGAAGSALAGCLGSTPREVEEDTDDGAPTDGDGPGLVASGEFAGDCPRYVSTGRVICWDAVESGSAPGFLEPSARTLTPDSEITFTLANRSGADLQTNFYNWQLHRRVDEEWFHVAPLSWPQPQMTVESGGSHTWTVSLDQGVVASGQAVERLRTTQDIVLAGVGGGQYAFRARGRFANDEYGTAMAFAATFDVDADPLDLTPTGAIQDVEVDGETVRAVSTRPGPADADPRLYELERLDPPVVEAEEMVTEQIVRREPLRNAVALAEAHDAQRVEITERNGALPTYAGNTVRPIENRGNYYGVTSGPLEE